MPFIFCRFIPLVSILIALTSSPTRGAWAAGIEDLDPSGDRGIAIGLAREGRCDPALEILARLVEAAPADAELARLRGECALRLQDLRLAIESLELAESLEPGEGDVDLHLGMAYYHAGRLDDAEAALVRAGAQDGARPEFLLYSGLVAYARTDYEAASRRLTAARERDEAPVEPMASFFLGRASLGLDRRDHAKAAFERVLEEHPGTAWAEEAQRALTELESGGWPWWVSAEVGFEHDDNPLLRGGGVGLPSEIAGQGDQRFFWFLDLGTHLYEGDGWLLGGMLRYAGSEHLELERFDTHAPGATLWLDRELGVAEASLRLQYDFDLALIDFQALGDEPFVISHQVGASLYKPWHAGIYTILSTSVGRDHYGYDRRDFLPDTGGVGGPGTTCNEAGVEFCGPANVDESDATDRDGTGLRASVLQHVPLPFDGGGFTNPWIESEYEYRRYWSEGSEYDHQRHQVELGFGIQLPLEIGLRVRGRYAYVPYGNASVFPDPSDVEAARRVPPATTGSEYLLDNSARREHMTGVRVSLARAIGEHAVVTLRYSRTRNRSSADVFDYTRDLFGLSVRFGLGG